jgi:hypothetical protein
LRPRAQLQSPAGTSRSRRHSSRCQTARFAASAAQPISFPRRIVRVRVVASCSLVSTASLLPWPALRRGSRPNPWRQLQLRPRNEGPAERREAYHLKIVAPVRRDLTLARRARPAQPGRPPLGAPPWRCPGPAASPAFPPEPGQGWLAGHRSWPATDPGFDHGYEPRPTPHPAPPAGSSPETPLMSEDDKSCTIYSLRSQELNSNRSRFWLAFSLHTQRFRAVDLFRSPRPPFGRPLTA